MSRPNPALLAAFILALIAYLGGLAVAKGGFFLGKHEGDTLHFLQIVSRMAAGELPHLDFMTPLGGLAFAPFAWAMEAGLTIGDAIIWSQIAVALVLAPAVWWIGVSRLNFALGAYLGLITMVLALALVHGEAERTISISMHYNRWAWAASFIAITAALVPPVRVRLPALDGIIIGSMMVALVMIKVTYFAAFALPITLALVLTGQRKALLWAIGTGLVLAALITAFVGPAYWLAYLGDLMEVRGSQVRPQPGEDLNAVIVAPLYKGASLLLIMSVILLRQGGQASAGLVLFLLVPGFFYVSYQNFGNDPQWLYLLPLILLAHRPEREMRGMFGWEMGRAMGIAAAMAMAFAMPSFFNLAFSPSRHFIKDVTEFSPLVPGDPRFADLQLATVRASRVDIRTAADGDGSGLEPYRTAADRDPEIVFLGETLPFCTTEMGLSALMATIAADLDAQGLSEGKRVFAADLFTSYWLFGALEPVPGGAPWYYGGLPGYAEADYLLVPRCPISAAIQRQILTAISEAGTDTIAEVHRTPLYTLYSKR